MSDPRDDSRPVGLSLSACGQSVKAGTVDARMWCYTVDLVSKPVVIASRGLVSDAIVELASETERIIVPAVHPSLSSDEG